jgi:hypothetical protein
MLGIPLFFYDCYSSMVIYYLQIIFHNVEEIAKILPEHFIVRQFHDFFHQMTHTLEKIIDENTMKEYSEETTLFYSLLKVFDELQREIQLFEGNRRVRSRVRQYYKNLFLRKKLIIHDSKFRENIDLTLNSLLMKEMKHELYQIKRFNYPHRKFKNDLNVVLEEELVLAS